MKPCARTLATLIIAGLWVSAAEAGQIYGIGYSDIATDSTVNLTTAGSLDWVKWGNGESGNVAYTTPVKVGSSIINPTLTPLGSPPQGTSVALIPFAPVANTTPLFTWTDGTIAMAGGNPVGTSVSQTIVPAQSSYPNGLGLSFQVAAAATPEELTLYVAGFNTRMDLSASLSGGGSDSLLASNAALVPVASGSGNNYFSLGVFSVVYAGAGETLTIDLTAANQSGIPTDAPQYLFPNAGVYAAVVNQASVPEPATIVLSAIGFVGLFGWKLLRRTRIVV
jgi:hypothetical protein